MSEFSESYHAYTGNRGSVTTMLRSAGVSGFIAASNDRCVSFTIADAEREADVIAAGQGVLARYYFGEDHGLWVHVYRDGEKLTTIALVWDEDAGDLEEPQEAEPPAEIVEKLERAGVLGAEEAEELGRVLEAFSPEDPGSCERAAEAVPRLLGFAAHAWLSAAYVQSSSPEELRDLFPGAEAVEIA
jgi:hypothetical protein